MENPVELLSQIGAFLWVVVGLLVYALAGGALMGLVDLLSRLRNTQATQREYLLALGLSFLVGIFIEWNSTAKIMQELKNERTALGADLKQLRIDFGMQTSELTKSQANVTQTQTALAQAQKDNGDLRESKDDLSTKVRIFEATSVPQLQVTSMPHLAPTNGTDIVLVIPMVNSGKVPAKVDSTNVYVFINEKLHYHSTKPNKPFNFMPGVPRNMVAEFEEVSIHDVMTGKLKMRFVVEIKYRGAINDKHSYCGKGGYDPEIRQYQLQSSYDEKCDRGPIS